MRCKITAPSTEILELIQAYLSQHCLRVYVVSEKRLFVAADVPTEDARDALATLGANLEEDPVAGSPDTRAFGHLLAHGDLVIYDENFADPFSFKVSGELATLGEWMDESAPQSVLDKLGRQRPIDLSPVVRPLADLDAQEFRLLTAEIYSKGAAEEALATDGRSFTRDEQVLEIQNGSAIGVRLMEAVHRHLHFIEYAVMTRRVEPGGPMPKEIELPDIENFFK